VLRLFVPVQFGNTDIGSYWLTWLSIVSHFIPISYTSIRYGGSLLPWEFFLVITRKLAVCRLAKYFTSLLRYYLTNMLRFSRLRRSILRSLGASNFAPLALNFGVPIVVNLRNDH